jgi:hypothetical protein
MRISFHSNIHLTRLWDIIQYNKCMSMDKVECSRATVQSDNSFIETSLKCQLKHVGQAAIAKHSN